MFQGWMNKNRVPTHSITNTKHKSNTYLFIASKRGAQWNFYHTTLEHVINLLGHGFYDSFTYWVEKMNLHQTMREGNRYGYPEYRQQKVDTHRFYSIIQDENGWLLLNEYGNPLLHPTTCQCALPNEAHHFIVPFANEPTHQINALNWVDSTQVTLTGMYLNDDYTDIVICYKVKEDDFFSNTQTANLSDFHSSLVNTMEQRFSRAMIGRVSGRSKGTTKIHFGTKKKQRGEVKTVHSVPEREEEMSPQEEWCALLPIPSLFEPA
jgi:hypothetical protein